MSKPDPSKIQRKRVLLAELHAYGGLLLLSAGLALVLYEAFGARVAAGAALAVWGVGLLALFGLTLSRPPAPAVPRKPKIVGVR